MRTIDKIKDIIRKNGGNPPDKNRISDHLDCLCDCTPSVINPDISLKDFVEGTLEEFKSDYVKTVEAYSFYSLKTLKSVDVGSAEKIGRQAFQNCTALESVSLGSAKKIEKQAFYGCTALKTLILGNKTEVCELEDNNAFKNTLIEGGTGSIYVPVQLLDEYKNDEKWSVYSDCFNVICEGEEFVNGCSEIYDTESTFLRPYAFYTNQSLKKIAMTKVAEIGNRAFSQLPLLETVEFPELTTLTGGVFLQCNKIKSMSFPKLQTMDGTTSTVLDQMEGLECFDAPNVTTLAGMIISRCHALKELNFPLVTTLSRNCFTSCTSVVSINFTSLTAVPISAFASFHSLRCVDFPAVTSIARDSFYQNKVLSNLALRSETVCTLENVSAFNLTPFAQGGSGGVVLVPSALVETYKTATNWSTLYGYGTCEFLPLEEYTVDGTTTGEIDWDKLNGREAAAAE